ncbi:MAG: electron transport complex subunit RsxC [Ruminococcaceae bacterium]|nr:electron transport complex subunit RsxC [Oscillospiraceae bacterium]
MPLFSLPGVHVPHRKNTSDMAAVKGFMPKTVLIPTAMHIGKPANVCVKVNQQVKVGEIIATADGFVSSNIYSSVSGTVKKIDNLLLSSGSFAPAVLIESDGLFTPFEGITPPEITDYKSFIDALTKSGIVGLGGAGFPTQVKLSVKDLSLIDEIIVNGAECEPYITSDTRTMIDDAEKIKEGVELLEKYLLVKKVTVGIEKNKPEAIKKMSEVFASDSSVTVKALPSLYPQGGEKVLIFNITGKVVPEGKLPIDVGVIVINCTTLAAIADFVKTGMPLVNKCVTIDGSAIKEPKNLIAPIGSSIEELIEFAGGFKEEPGKVFYGGPMMGIAVPDLSAPILKNTNAIIALNKKDSVTPEPTECIRCGKCLLHCPFSLQPVKIAAAYNAKDGAELKNLKVNLCMECGCCSFICPARRPLVQTNRLAKGYLREFLALEAKKAKEENK